MVCHILNALLGDEPSLTGTEFYVGLLYLRILAWLHLRSFSFFGATARGWCTNVYRQLWELVLTSILSGIDPLSFISKGGANILDCYGHLVRDEFIHCCSRRCRLCVIRRQRCSLWCNVMHWHCWWEYHQRSEFVIGTCHSCSNYDLEYVQFCDLVILWHRGWYDRDDRHICDFVILWHTVMELWWSEHLHVWRIVILDRHGFYNHDFWTIYDLVNLML